MVYAQKGWRTLERIDAVDMRSSFFLSYGLGGTPFNPTVYKDICMYS